MYLSRRLLYIILGTSTPSCNWVTSIMNKALTNDSGHFNKIQVVFALAPPEFPFTVYTISLHNVNDISPVSAVNVTKDVSVSKQHSSLIRKIKNLFNNDYYYFVLN